MNTTEVKGLIAALNTTPRTNEEIKKSLADLTALHQEVQRRSIIGANARTTRSQDLIRIKNALADHLGCRLTYIEEHAQYRAYAFETGWFEKDNYIQF